MKNAIITILFFLLYNMAIKAQVIIQDSFNQLSEVSKYETKFYTQLNWQYITIRKPNYPEKESYMFQTVMNGNADDYLRFPNIKFRLSSHAKVEVISPVQYKSNVLMITQDHESSFQFLKKTPFNILGTDGTLFHYYLKQSNFLRKPLPHTLQKNVCYKFYINVYHPQAPDTIISGKVKWWWNYSQSDYLQKEFVPDIILAKDSNIRWEYLDSTTGIANGFRRAVCTNTWKNGTLNAWVTLEYTYQASGNENFVYIGSINPLTVAYPFINSFLGKSVEEENATLLAMKKSTALRSVTLFSNFNMIEIAPVKLINDTVLCTKSRVILKDLNYRSESKYTWLNSDNNITYPANGEGIYTVKRSIGSCTEYDTVKVSVVQIDNYTITGPNQFCAGDSISLKIKMPLNNQTYSWNNGKFGKNIQVHLPGIYKVFIQIGNCNLSDSITIREIAKPHPIQLPDSIFCEQVNWTINLQNAADAIQWTDDNAIGKIRTIQKPGTYSYQLRNENICTYSDSFTVSLQKKPRIDLRDTAIPCAGEKFTFTNYQEYTKYTWNDTLVSNKYEAIKSGTLKILAQNYCGVEEKTIQINLGNKLCGLYIPNAFTPNADGINDVFKINTSIALSDIEIRILNRWGQLIWEGANVNSGWNGNDSGGIPCADGVYVAEIKGTLQSSGLPINGRFTVHLLR